MEQCNGKSILPKMVIGKVFYYEKQETVVKRKKSEDAECEIERFEKASTQARRQLESLYEKARTEVGETEAEVFEVHKMMLEDEDYVNSIYHIIRGQEMCAEYAAAVTGDNFATMFASMEDEYMKARAVDVKDVSNRLIDILSGEKNNRMKLTEPVILVVDDLAPSETVQLDKSKLLGFATRYGSSNSHTAILARTMNIPALIEVDIKKEWHNELAILNGYTGQITIAPDEEALDEAREIVKEEKRQQELLKQFKGQDTITKRGRKIHLFANIGSVSDTAMVLFNDAEGIGLFRSEFLYLESKDFPSEQEQYKAYKMVAESMAGKKVIIRTLDIGADKQVDYFGLAKEENPALGYRAIRICLTRKDVFKTQLRAILQASIHGEIAIMFPMIISVKELMEAKSILQEAKEELKEEGVPYQNIEVGVMIETPAAVMISEELGKEVDFFSIGTNDLTQYTLAIDRQNPKLESFYDSHHPAILAMIQMTIDNGHKNGAWVGICGELASDLRLTETFLKMGIDELSVSPACVLPLREKIRSLNG